MAVQGGSLSTCVAALRVRTRLSGDQAVLVPRGEIDRASAPCLDQALTVLPEEVGRVALDMAEVTFMDSAGLHFLRRLDAFGQQRGVLVTSVNWGRQPRRVLALAGAHLPAAHSALQQPVTAAFLPLRRTEPAPGGSGPGGSPPRSPRALLTMVPESAPHEEDDEKGLPHRDARRGLCGESPGDSLGDSLGDSYNHPVIDQACGMIMVLGPCTVQEARKVLAEVSQQTHTELGLVAKSLVATTTGVELPRPVGRALTTALRRRRRLRD